MYFSLTSWQCHQHKSCIRYLLNYAEHTTIVLTCILVSISLPSGVEMPFQNQRLSCLLKSPGNDGHRGNTNSVSCFMFQSMAALLQSMPASAGTSHDRVTTFAGATQRTFCNNCLLSIKQSRYLLRHPSYDTMSNISLSILFI